MTVLPMTSGEKPRRYRAMGLMDVTGRAAAHGTSRQCVAATVKVGAPRQPGDGTRKETNMSEQPTCGKGLAEHSAFPARFGDLLAAMAENLEVHLSTLDPTDEATEAERHAYRKPAGARLVAPEVDRTW